eukprot:465532_1
MAAVLIQQLIHQFSPNTIGAAIKYNSCSNVMESDEIKLPKYIPFIRDEINKKWMQQKMKTFEYEYGVKISSLKDDDWLPTPHGLTMSDAICKAKELNNIFRNKNVLELGSGAGNHTALILKQKPNKLTVTEITKSRLNATKNTLNINNLNDNNVEYVVGDWLHLDHLKMNKCDVIITNPPFAASGKRNRRYFIDELIFNSSRYLADNGHLIFIQSSMALFEQTIYRLKQNGYNNIKIVNSAKYYWRDYYFKDKTFVNEAN